MDRSEAEAAPPRFALLEHRQGGGVHWDFLLDAGEALRTWAVDAPIVAGAWLPARALADHRRIYLDYEGEIAGGRGTVRRIDGGTYRAVAWGDREVKVVVAGRQLAGFVSIRAVAGGGPSDRREPEPWEFRLGKLDWST